VVVVWADGDGGGGCLGTWGWTLRWESGDGVDMWLLRVAKRTQHVEHSKAVDGLRWLWFCGGADTTKYCTA
jgi:hypothetical protein